MMPASTMDAHREIERRAAARALQRAGYADQRVTAPTTWPEALSAEAYIGVAGELVRAIEPYTEADPAALFVHLLTGLGNLIGRGPHFTVGGAKHHLNLFAIMVGQSSRGRKGQSASDLIPVFERADDDWLSGVNYFFRLATTISPDRRQLQF
jgi:hypothetical protein